MLKFTFSAAVLLLLFAGMACAGEPEAGLSAFSDLTGFSGNAQGAARALAAEVCQGGGAFLADWLGPLLGWGFAVGFSFLSAVDHKIPWFAKPFVRAAAGDLWKFAGDKFVSGPGSPLQHS